jgi:hypothetical protein
MEAAQKVALEPLASALGVAAFLHNVIIVHPLVLLDAGYLFMHYNATLCKEALEKKITGMSCEAYAFLSQKP